MAATTPKKIRIEDDLWATFGEVAPAPENHGYRDGQSGGRSGIIRDFLRYYVGEPGAKCPRRPAAAVERAKQQPATAAG